MQIVHDSDIVLIFILIVPYLILQDSYSCVCKYTPRRLSAMAGLGFIALTPAQVEARDKAQREESVIKIGEPAQSSLVSYLNAAWTDAREAKTTKQTTMLSCAKRKRGEYDSDKLAQIRSTQRSEIFLPATSIKVRSAHTQLREIYQAPNTNPWQVKPTPIPDLPKELQIQSVMRVTQEIQGSNVPLSEDDIQALDDRAQKEIFEAMNEDAKDRAERMSRKIEDILTEGGWMNAFVEVLDDIVTYPIGVLKGPVIRMEKRRTGWKIGENGKRIPIITNKAVLEYERVSPLDWYPARNLSDVDSGYCFEHMRLNRRKIKSMKGVPGYNDAEIDAALKEYGTTALPSSWLWSSQEADEAENRDFMMQSPEGQIDALEFWGEASGQMLLDWGMSADKIKDPLEEYQITAILIGKHVVRAVLNPNTLGKKPYYVESWEKVNGSIWGRGLIEIIAPLQDMLNAVARALINNIAMASGPQVARDVAQMAGEQKDTIEPWAIWDVDSSKNSILGPQSQTRLPIEFSYPEMQGAQLLQLMQAFMTLIDEYSGLPSFTHGVGESTGPGSTATGFSMLITATGKIIKDVASQIDRHIVSESVQGAFDHVMQYDHDDSCKGDLEVVASGAASVLAKEQQLVRMLELLDRTKNDIDMQIIGLKGRAEILREVFHRFDLDLDHIIPEANELMEQEAQMKAAIAQEQMAKTTNLDQPAPQSLNVDGSPISGTDTAVFLPPQGGQAA